MTGTARERPPTAAEPDLIRILHLSDTHLSGEGTLHHGMVDTTAALRRVLDRAAAVGRLDLVVASGDLSDDGSEASYRVLRDLLEPWADARGAAVIYTMGNHDLLAGFRAVLGDVRSVSRVRAGYASCPWIRRCPAPVTAASAFASWHGCARCWPSGPTWATSWCCTTLRCPRKPRC